MPISNARPCAHVSHGDVAKPCCPGSFVDRRSAFTVIELVIVMLVMSILAAVAAPKFVNSLLFYRVETAARRVKADIERVRQTARLTSSGQSVTFASSTYTTSTSIKSLDSPTQTNSVDLAASPYKLTSVTANFGGQASISFNGYGTPSSGGTVLLVAKNHQCTVTVNSATGDVTISSSHPGGGAS